MADPQDMILPILREMRAELRAGFARVERNFASLDPRFDDPHRRFGDVERTLKARSDRHRRTPQTL